MNPGDELNASTGKVPTGSKALLIWLILVLAVIGLVFGFMQWQAKPPALRQAQSKSIGSGGYQVSAGPDTVFAFDGSGNRVLVQDAEEFHFSTNQDFSVEAWVRAYPVSSRLARWLSGWLGGHPKIARLTPGTVTLWLSSHARDNDFGVTPVVDKHQTPSTIQSIGFQLYLDSGRLACQLSAAPMRQLAFQNFISAGPNLQDGRWHHIALSVTRDAPAGGKLYVDGRRVLVFDPTQQNGDLSNSEPLRIGNHANPGLRCWYKGLIGKVTLSRFALSAEEVRRAFQSGHP